MTPRAVDWTRWFNGLMLAVVIASLLTAGFIMKRKWENRTARIQEVTDALVKLKKEYGLVNQKRKSERELMSRVREQNKDLADQLDKAGARIQGLVTLSISYKKETKRLKAKLSDLQKKPGKPDRMTFHREFNLATLDGWFTADRIVNPRESEFTLAPKTQHHEIITTDQGTVPVPSSGSTITVAASRTSRPWWDGLGVMAGGDAGPGGGSGMVGVDWRGWGVYVRTGSDGQSVGILRRWTLGRKK